MKKKINFEIKKKDLVVFFILVFISILSIVFVNNNDSLYKTDILKITSIKTISTDYDYNDLGVKEEYKTRSISGIITNKKGKNKKITIKYEETKSSVATEKYRVGDKVFVKYDNIDGLKRDKYIVYLIIVFVIAIYLVGKFRGLLAILSVVLNTTLFYFGLTLYFKGVNLVVLCLLESIIFTIISLIIASGFNKKTYSAIVSVFVSMIVLFLMTFIIIKTTNYSGISFNGMSFLTVPVEEVFFAELLIGGLGAIMDVCITVSSSIGELIDKDKKISTSNLRKSTKAIGSDIMSTMINVLFFTYLCSGLPVFVLAIRNGFSMTNYISTSFSLEITRFLIGSIGIVLAIPIASFISIWIFKRGDNDE